jgi:hypothetical protein
MAEDDDLFDDDDFAEDSADGGADGGDPASGARGADGESLGINRQSIREWMNARRGALMIVALSVAMGIASTIVIRLRSQATPVAEIRAAAVRDLATDMLGHEVKINQIYQLLPMRGGRRMTVGLDLVLVLGQLPEERVEGAPRPDAEEMALFAATIGSMEPSIRSMVNIMLQQIPAEDLGAVSGQNTIKDEVRDYVNDTLDGLDFGAGLRPGIGKRRVTDVFLPMFVTQYL